MTIVYSADFTVAATTPLEEYPSAGSPDFASIYGAAALSVDPTQDAVYVEGGFGTGDFLYQVINAAAPTGDYEATIIGTVVGATFTQVYVGVRMSAAGGGNGYFIQRASATTFDLWKLTAGSWGGAPVASYSVAVAAGSTVHVKLKVTGTNPVVVTPTINGAVQTAYSDSSGTRHTSGVAGLGGYLVGGDSTAYTSLFFIDNLATPSTFGDTTPGGSSFPATNDRAIVRSFTLSGNADLRSMTLYFDGTSTAGSQHKGLIFADSGGLPGALLASTPEGYLPPGGTVLELPISGTLMAGTYWLGGVANGFEARWAADVSAGGQRKEGYSFASPPGTFGTPDGTTTDGISALVSYVAVNTGGTYSGSGQITISGAAPSAYVNGATGRRVRTSLGTSALGVGPVLTSSRIRAASGGGTTYSYSASGQLTLSGTPPRSRTKAFLPTGTVLITGTPPRSRTKAFLPTGTFTLAGSGTTSTSTLRSFVGSGQFSIAGTALWSRTKHFTASGTVPITGAATTTFTGATIKTYTGTGQLSTSGAAPLSKTKAFLPTGGVAITGTSLLSRARAFNASGSLVIAGAALLSRIKAFLASGQLTISGAATTIKQGNGLNQYTGSGQLVISGAATRLKVKVFSPAGGVTLSGAAALSKTKVFGASGQVSFAGAAPTSAVSLRLYTGSGLVQTSGAAIVSRARDFRASGNLLISGTAPRSKAKAWLLTGGLSITGSTLLQRLKVYSPSGVLSIAGAFGTSYFDASTGIETRRTLSARAPDRKYSATAKARTWSVRAPTRVFAAKLNRK